ncbi:MAG: hypothetical protein K8R41_10920 [Bacteroidales bacterium]|nr:hypothetical protein [Bacteroidales bacterium]
MINSKLKIRYFLLILAVIGVNCVSAQIRINSPYSLFGIGQINHSNNNVKSFAMGGLSYSLRNSQFINVANPASYTAFDSASFLFEGGFNGSFLRLQTTEVTENTNSASLNYLTFGIPVTKWWRSSFGLLPFSDVGYNISEEHYLENIGNVQYINKGEGGVNQVFWGNAFKITKNLSIGVNAKYLFGTIYKNRIVAFPDSVYVLNTDIQNSIITSDLYFTYGLQYHKKFKNNIIFGAGLVYSHSTKIKARKEILTRSFLGGVTNVVSWRDTISYISDIKGNYVIPVSVGGGISFQKKDKWLIGADISWQKWEDYSSFEVSDSLQNSLNFSLGGQFIPNKYSIFSYWEKVNYRFGLRYSKSYLQLREHQINEIGLSAGLGLPLWKTKSTFNFGIEIGKKGTTIDNLIQENYVKFTFGVTFYQKWFLKKRYQ